MCAPVHIKNGVFPVDGLLLKSHFAGSEKIFDPWNLEDMRVPWGWESVCLDPKMSLTLNIRHLFFIYP
jgi:hypothetical protein